MDIMGCNMQYIGRDLSAMEMNRKGHMMAAKHTELERIRTLAKRAAWNSGAAEMPPKRAQSCFVHPEPIRPDHLHGVLVEQGVALDHEKRSGGPLAEWS
jgi:hypothetical protein